MEIKIQTQKKLLNNNNPTNFQNTNDNTSNTSNNNILIVLFLFIYKWLLQRFFILMPEFEKMKSKYLFMKIYTKSRITVIYKFQHKFLVTLKTFRNKNVSISIKNMTQK